MTKKRNVVRNKPIPEAFKGKVYLDPTYDPAFKELFDNEDALKDFLNGVLELDGIEMIKELRFRFEKPIEFRVPQRKKVIFDIFATTGSGRFLNIEMQRLDLRFRSARRERRILGRMGTLQQACHQERDGSTAFKEK